MGNVIALPEKSVQEWHVLEKRTRAFLAELGEDQEMIDYVCTVMRPIYLDSVYTDIKFERSDDPDETMKKVNEWFGNYSFRLFEQLILREVELYSLRGKK
jgi:hypothetical protein